MRLASLPSRGRRAFERWWRRLRGIERRIVTLRPPGEAVGRALFSYILDPLQLPRRAAIPHSHTHYWESRRMAHTLVDLGFVVDAVHWTNSAFVPTERYDLVIDVRSQLERFAGIVGPRPLKILHAETAHWRFYNDAQARRREDLASRRGIQLAPYKTLEPNRALESADAVTILGNAATQATYEFAGKPLFPIPISQPFLYPFPEGKDFGEAARRFVWFGSGGLLHKGLDRVLEVFAELPDLELTVLGPVDREPEFERAFARELYRSPNIRTRGFVDVAGRAFLDVARTHGALIYPSCSEGQNGGTVTCMHAGLIPIVSRETGVDVNVETGVVLERSTLDEIRERVVALSRRSPQELAGTSRRAWEWVRRHHTRERFESRYLETLLEILERFRPELRGAVRPAK